MNPDLEDCIRQAPLASDGWSIAISKIASAFASCGGVLFDANNRSPKIIISPRLDESTEFYEKNGVGRYDLRLRAIAEFGRSGVALDQHLISDGERRSHQYCRDFLDRFNLRWAAVLGLQSEAGLWALSLQRTRSQDAFSARDARLLLSLRSALSDAISLSRQLQGAHLAGTLEALNLVSCAALLVDRTGCLIDANNNARALEGVVHKIKSGKLHLCLYKNGVQYDRSVDVYFAEDEPLSFILTDAEGKHRPVRIVRFGNSANLAFRRAAMLLLVGPSRIDLTSPQAAAAMAFGLTASEFQLAREIARGTTLNEAADHFGLTLGTVRDRLKIVFQKVGVNRQVDLAIALRDAGIC